MDAVRVCPLSRLLPRRRGARRIQREIHDQPNRPARRILCHSAGAYPRLLPQLLPRRRPLAIQWCAARRGCHVTKSPGAILDDAQRRARWAEAQDGPSNRRGSRPGAADWLLIEEVLTGLRATPKRLSPAYLYDPRGSQLFEAICDLPEYYLTRTETGILARHAAEMAACIGERALLLEPGSGSSRKTRLLLDALPDLDAYVPVDISRTHLLDAARAVQAGYPRLEVLPVCADFTQGFELPPLGRPPSRVVVFFPGSTLGNFDAPEAIRLLELMRRTAGARGGLLVGIDMAKDPAILERAYNDAAGVTAAFNLNLLVRLNRELAADFDEGSF